MPKNSWYKLLYQVIAWVKVKVMLMHLEIWESLHVNYFRNRVLLNSFVEHEHIIYFILLQCLSRRCIIKYKLFINMQRHNFILPPESEFGSDFVFTDNTRKTRKDEFKRIRIGKLQRNHNSRRIKTYIWHKYIGYPKSISPLKVYQNYKHLSSKNLDLHVH